MERLLHRQPQRELRRGRRQPRHRCTGQYRGHALGPAFHRMAQPPGHAQRRALLRRVHQRRERHASGRHLRPRHPRAGAIELVDRLRALPAGRGRAGRRQRHRGRGRRPAQPAGRLADPHAHARRPLRQRGDDHGNAQWRCHDGAGRRCDPRRPVLRGARRRRHPCRRDGGRPHGRADPRRQCRRLHEDELHRGPGARAGRCHAEPAHGGRPAPADRDRSAARDLRRGPAQRRPAAELRRLHERLHRPQRAQARVDRRQHHLREPRDVHLPRPAAQQLRHRHAGGLRRQPLSGAVLGGRFERRHRHRRAAARAAGHHQRREAGGEERHPLRRAAAHGLCHARDDALGLHAGRRGLAGQSDEHGGHARQPDRPGLVHLHQHRVPAQRPQPRGAAAGQRLRAQPHLCIAGLHRRARREGQRADLGARGHRHPRPSPGRAQPARLRRHAAGSGQRHPGDGRRAAPGPRQRIPGRPDGQHRTARPGCPGARRRPRPVRGQPAGADAGQPALRQGQPRTARVAGQGVAGAGRHDHRHGRAEPRGGLRGVHARLPRSRGRRVHARPPEGPRRRRHGAAHLPDGPARSARRRTGKDRAPGAGVVHEGHDRRDAGAAGRLGALPAIACTRAAAVPAADLPHRTARSGARSERTGHRRAAA
ncbi:hypothetical protein D9M72_286100 [compost metagenome]